jgi:hypothetical protein
MSTRSFRSFSIIALWALWLLAAGATVRLAAQPSRPEITVQQASCFRYGENQAVYASTLGEPGGATARLYFQWLDHPYYYWVDFEHDLPTGANGAGTGATFPGSGGTGAPSRYWATPPKPESRNHEIEYYGVLLSSTGREIARSQTFKSKVTSDCQIKLTPQQLGAAQNLTIGETSFKQNKDRVNGFLCDGIVTRVNPDNVKRADEICRTCVIAWWAGKELLLPVLGAAGLGGITSVIVDKPEPSPSRP